MIAIPAIDIINNQIVRLLQGDYNKVTFYPREVATYSKELNDLGFEFLHLVDLSGAKIGKVVHIELLTKVCEKTQLKVDFGGGVKTEEDVRQIFEAGANQVVIGSLCVMQPELVIHWLTTFGADKFILALDTDGEFLKINGWQDATKAKLSDVLHQFSDFETLTILCTDIRRDGTGTGPSVDLYRDLITQFPNHRWIASGGVESIADLHELRSINCYACVIGKALLEEKISLIELKEFNDAV